MSWTKASLKSIFPSMHKTKADLLISNTCVVFNYFSLCNFVKSWRILFTGRHRGDGISSQQVFWEKMQLILTQYSNDSRYKVIKISILNGYFFLLDVKRTANIKEIDSIRCLNIFFFLWAIRIFNLRFFSQTFRKLCSISSELITGGSVLYGRQWV